MLQLNFFSESFSNRMTMKYSLFTFLYRMVWDRKPWSASCCGWRRGQIQGNSKYISSFMMFRHETGFMYLVFHGLFSCTSQLRWQDHEFHGIWSEIVWYVNFTRWYYLNGMKLSLQEAGRWHLSPCLFSFPVSMYAIKILCVMYCNIRYKLDELWLSRVW